MDLSGAFFQSLDWSPDGGNLAFAAVMDSWDSGYNPKRPVGSNRGGGLSAGVCRFVIGLDRVPTGCAHPAGVSWWL
jgi:hypothetical protein